MYPIGSWFPMETYPWMPAPPCAGEQESDHVGSDSGFRRPTATWASRWKVVFPREGEQVKAASARARPWAQGVALDMDDPSTSPQPSPAWTGSSLLAPTGSLDITARLLPVIERGRPQGEGGADDGPRRRCGRRHPLPAGGTGVGALGHAVQDPAAELVRGQFPHLLEGRLRPRRDRRSRR